MSVRYRDLDQPHRRSYQSTTLRGPFSFKTFGPLEHHHCHECRRKQYPTSVVGESFLIIQLSASFSSRTSHHQRISQTGIGGGNQCRELLHYKDIYRVRRHESRFLYNDTWDDTVFFLRRGDNEPSSSIPLPHLHPSAVSNASMAGHYTIVALQTVWSGAIPPSVVVGFAA